jgi:hypothetical protein
VRTDAGYSYCITTQERSRDTNLRPLRVGRRVAHAQRDSPLSRSLKREGEVEEKGDVSCDLHSREREKRRYCVGSRMIVAEQLRTVLHV